MDYTLKNIEERTGDYEDIHYGINPADDCCNATIIFNGKRSRLRAGIIILKDDMILLGEEADEPGVFSLPGGGLEENETPLEAAIREAQEEVFINVNNAVDTGFDYCECHDEVKDGVRDTVPEKEGWYNYYTCLVVATYDGEYEGKVDKVDLDKAMANSAKGYKLSEAMQEPSFKTQGKKAISAYTSLDERIVKLGSKWQVQSEKGRNMGTYDTKAEAEKRLKQVEYFKHLNEDTRAQLTNASRNAGPYKNQYRGKNRGERKKYSKVAPTTKQFNSIDMNKFFKEDLLDLQIPVTGETADYDVTIQLDKVCEEMQKAIKNNKNIFEYKIVIQALTKIFNTSNIRVKCNCDDFTFRMKHGSIVNNGGADDTAHDPGPGRGIVNPLDDKGKGCKHILCVLSNQDWLIKVANVIRNYILYMAEHEHKLFLKFIFPKLYGTVPEEAVDDGLVADQKDLQTSKNIIDTINDWAKNKGKFKAGQQINPEKGKNKLKGPGVDIDETE